jgi:glycosyltransferase involved in cell wall biosynthesis
MNILFIIPAELSRCQGRSIHPYCIKLQKLNHKVLVLHKNGIEDEDYVYPEYPTLPLMWENKNLSTALLSRVIKFNPDIVHIWNPWEDILTAGQQCCEKTGSKLILHHEDDLEYHHRLVSSSKAEQKYNYDYHIETIKNCHAMTAIWEPIANNLIAYEKPVFVLPPGLNKCEVINQNKRQKIKASVCRELGVTGESLLLGYSGSIRYMDSEFETFLKAFKEAADVNRNVNLLIWGRDWNPHLTYSLLEKYKLTSRAFLLGLLSEEKTLKLQQSVDILCCPGLNSTFNYYRLPSRLCYYFKFGKPVLTHKIGFGANLEHNKNAVLTETDDFKEWASKILSLINDEELRYKLSKNAGNVVEKYFEIEKNTNSLIQFYERTINNAFSIPKNIKNMSEPDYWEFKKPDYENNYKICAKNNAVQLKAAGKKSIAFYGAGHHTKQILSSGEFVDFKIVGIIDSNAQGKLNNIPVFSPSEPNLPYWDALLLSTDSQEHLMLEEAEKYDLKRTFSMYSFLFTSLEKVIELDD